MNNSALYAEGTRTEENKVIQEGQYNQEFIDEAENHLGQQVTISGKVSRTLSPETFTIVGPADPLLLLESQEILAVTEGESVEITGMMRESISAVEVEEQLRIDLEDELYATFEGENYVMATQGRAGG